MPKSGKDIAKDLLKTANYYWHDDNEDQVNPINPDDFDPVVDKIFKANAVELEKLYREIEESRQEIVLGLSKTLVPDQSLLPEPGYTVAQVQPKASRFFATPEDKFNISGQSDTGDKYDYYFTPLFDHDFPKCELKAIVTESQLLEVSNNEIEVLQDLKRNPLSNIFWLAFAIDKPKDTDVIPFFLGNKIIDEFDKDAFIFQSAKWFLNGAPEQELKLRIGVEKFSSASVNPSAELFGSLDVSNNYEQQIFSRFRNSFILAELPPDLSKNQHNIPPALQSNDLLRNFTPDQELCWIKVELPIALPNDYLIHNKLYPNSIPLVNRQLIEKYVVKSNYDRILLPIADHR